ncbi:hypothetical protein ACE1OE_03595 [Vibrio sp. E150_011]
MQSNRCQHADSHLHMDSLTLLRYLTLQPMGACYVDEAQSSIEYYLEEPLDKVLNCLESNEFISLSSEGCYITLTDYGLDCVELNTDIVA